MHIPNAQTKDAQHKSIAISVQRKMAAPPGQLIAFVNFYCTQRGSFVIRVIFMIVMCKSFQIEFQRKPANPIISTRMHSSRIRITRSLTVSSCLIVVGEGGACVPHHTIHVPPPCIPPAIHAPLPSIPPCHTHPLPSTPPAMHAPLPHSPHHACPPAMHSPPPHMPPCHACPLPTMHAPL